MNIMIRLGALVAWLSFSMLHLQGKPPTIQELAAFYGDQSTEIVGNYNQLVGKSRVIALHALDHLSSKRAFQVIALALPDADETLKSSMIEVLGRADDKDTLVVESLTQELRKMNADTSMKEGEEDAAYEMTKTKVVRILSKLTGATGTQIDVRNNEQVDHFISEVNDRVGKK